MRAQTTLDFAIGMSVFLVSVVFVLAFAPNMLGPFSDGPQEQTVIASRVSDQLAGGMLGSPDEPYVLDEACTVAFFENATSPAGCTFDAATPAEEQLGITRHQLNVTLERDFDGDGLTEVACWSGSALEACPGGGGVPMVRGEDASDTGRSVVVSRRVVEFGDAGTTIAVRVW